MFLEIILDTLSIFLNGNIVLRGDLNVALNLFLDDHSSVNSNKILCDSQLVDTGAFYIIK